MGTLDEMIAVEEHWPQAMQDRDRAWLLAHIREDLLCVQPDGLLDRTAYLSHRMEQNDTIVDGRSKVMRAEVIGGLGYVVNRAHFVFEDATGGQRELRIHGSAVYAWADATWKVVVMHLTQVPNDALDWEPLIDVPS